MSDLIARINIEIERDIELANGEDEQAHNQRHWPDRIERQAAAFRKILELHRKGTLPENAYGEDSPYPPSTWSALRAKENDGSYCVSCYREAWPCPTVLALADVYGLEGPAMLQAIPPNVWTKLQHDNVDVYHNAGHSVIVCYGDGPITTEPDVELRIRQHDEGSRST